MVSLMTFEQVMLELAVPHGSVEGWDRRRIWGLTAAALVDLQEAGRISLTPVGNSLEVVRLSAMPTGVPPLDAVLDRLGDRTWSMHDLLKQRDMNVEDTIAEFMADSVELDRKSILGLFPRRYRITNPQAKDALDTQLLIVLEGQPDSRATATLIILDGLRVLKQALPGAGSASGRQDLTTAVSQLMSGSLMFQTLRREVGHIGTFIPGFAAL